MAERIKMKKIIFVYETFFNTEWWSNVAENSSFRGKFYKIICADESEVITGFIFSKIDMLIKDEIHIAQLLNEAKKYLVWKEIVFEHINVICQENLISKLGSEFPWQNSIWGSEIAYNEWLDPKSAHNIVKRALSDRAFFEEICFTDKWNKLIAKRYSCEKVEFNSMQYACKDLLQLYLGIWLIEKRGFLYPGCGYWAELTECTSEKASEILKQNNE